MRARVGMVAGLVFASGLCALVYQVVWLRTMRLIFGASTAASAAVLAIFMGGLGIGGALLGARADAQRRPLRFYALLELGIALSAAVTPLLAEIARAAYVAVGGSVRLGTAGATITRLLLAALVLCVPTVLMGGTLPAAAKAVELAADARRRHVAVLYGVNTLGAVVGALLATFMLLEQFGARQTLWLAGGLNVLIGLIALALAQWLPALAVSSTGSIQPRASKRREEPSKERHRGKRLERTVTPVETAAPAALSQAPPWFVWSAAAVVGCAFFLMELVWYRMLGPLLGGSSYTFGLILAVALLGIGLGGASYALGASERPATLRAFALTCAIEALVIAFPYALGDWVAFVAQAARTLGTFGFYGLVIGWAQIVALIVLPAAFVAGVQFPLLVALLGRGGEQVGRHVGMAYAWNTAGSIVGSLAGGFGLLGLLTAPGTWQLVVAILVGLSTVALIVGYRREGPAPGLVVALIAAAGALMLLRAPGPTAAWRHAPIGAGRSGLSGSTINDVRNWMNGHRRAIEWETDGIESTVAMDTESGLAFVVNGKSDGNALGDMSTQVMGGLIGAILHPQPRRAFVVGLGTGSTAGWLGAIATMERIDVVELEPAIREIARRSAPVNHDVLANPKVHLFFGDAREVLQTTRERYDIIFSEPSNPYRAGIASLFTREFYQAVASRLAAGGIFLQWVQSYEVDSQTVRTIYATLVAEFPVVETYETQRGDLILVASQQAISYDVPALRRRLQDEPYRSALAKVWRVGSLEGLLARFVADSRIARAVAEQEGRRLNTDDKTLVEYGFARNVGRGGLFSDEELWHLARAENADRPAVRGGEIDWAAVTDQRVATYVANDETPPPLPDAVSQEQLRRALALAHYADGELGLVLEAWRSQPKEPTLHTELVAVAEALAAQGDDAALPYIERLRELSPTAAETARARLRLQQGRYDEAAQALEASLTQHRTDPWPMAAVTRSVITLAEALVAAAPSYAGRMYAALREPFVLANATSRRRLAAFHIANQAADPTLCVEALTALEPHVPWDQDFLTARLACYRRAQHPDLARAQADLDRYTRELPSPFDQALPSQ